nr:hypothetical protein [Tanacetum cinerariifolium]
MRYEDGGESLENVVESGGGDDGVKGCLVPCLLTLVVGNKMHTAFPLLEESSHWQYNFLLPVEGVPTARGMEIPLPRVCTAMIKKLPIKENWQLH